LNASMHRTIHLVIPVFLTKLYPGEAAAFNVVN
jgi:hypothetical protein